MHRFCALVPAAHWYPVGHRLIVPAAVAPAAVPVGVMLPEYMVCAGTQCPAFVLPIELHVASFDWTAFPAEQFT
jgi:hypothetical protein